MEFKCNKCRMDLPRERFAADDNMGVPICGDCYANDYKHDIEEITKLLEEYKRISLLPKDIVKEIMKDDFDKIERLVYSSSDDDIANSHI